MAAGNICNSFCCCRYVLEDVDRQWPNLDIDGDGYVTWDEYRNRTYGYMSGMVICCWLALCTQIISELCAHISVVCQQKILMFVLVFRWLSDPVDTQLDGL